jgi:hypothetical protein
VRAVEAGATESYALMDDGSVRAWGQIRCDGGVTARVEPHPVALPLVGGDVRQLSSGSQWTLFLKKDGTVLSCGKGAPVSGRPPGDALVPLAVTGLGPGSGVVDVTAGQEGGLALKDDGSVWAWGLNANGWLSPAGVPLGGAAPAPVELELPPGPPVVDVDVRNACHALALRADGSVLAWGCDYFGQVGDGPSQTGAPVTTPTVIDLQGSTAYGVSASQWNSLVLARPADDGEWERPATWVEASVADATAGEGGGAFAISLSAALPHDVTVEWSAVEAGTADGADVAFGGHAATVPAGATSVEVPAPVLDDARDEDDETFTIVLRKASNGIRLDRSQATATIADDDGPPAVSARPATVAEGGTSLTDATLAVELSEASGKPVEVAFATADGAATSPDDYQAASGSVAFEPGQRKAFVHVAVRGDTVVEPTEALTLALSEPENATLGDAEATLTIADDDPLALAVESPEVPEGDDGAAPATFTVTLEPAPPAGNVESERTLVVRIDKTAPTVSCTASPHELWPPNHKLVPITVAVEVADAAAGSHGVVLESVTSNEPDDARGGGDGKTVEDIQGFEPGTNDTAGLIRAERAGTGNDRVYTLTYVARDRARNEQICRTTVTVPHSRHREAAARRGAPRPTVAHGARSSIGT